MDENLPGVNGPPDTPRVDVLVVNYNGRKWLSGLVDSLAQTRFSTNWLRLIVVDNASRDDSVALLQSLAGKLPFPLEIVRSPTNLGFAGGYELAFGRAKADYCFVLNQDTHVAPDAIGRLVDVLEADPRAGIAEARQAPRELNKHVDARTRETSWASGACMMVRSTAIQDVGGGFDPAFFMYFEDVELSWRMWLKGWKCLYVPEAVVEHFGPAEPGHGGPLAHHYMVRNSVLIRIIFGRWSQVALHCAKLLRSSLFSTRPIPHRWRILRGLLCSFGTSVHGWRKRRQLAGLGPHPWVFFDGGHCGRLEPDRMDRPPPAVIDGTTVQYRGTAEFERCAALQSEAPSCGHMDLALHAEVGGKVKRAIVMRGSALLRMSLAECPPGVLLTGQIGVATPSGKKPPKARFLFEQDDHILWDVKVDPRSPGQQRWFQFAVPLRANPERTAQIGLRFVSGGRTMPLWGYWSGLELRRMVPPDGLSADSVPAEKLPAA